MIGTTSHRLDGLEPDNPLAFLALLGLLRALDAAELYPRAAWDIDTPPLRLKLILARGMTREEVTESAARGLDKDLKHSPEECRALLEKEVKAARLDARERADLLAALMSDAAVKYDKKNLVVDPTPLCLLSGQGHQHFLGRGSPMCHGIPRCRAARARRPSPCLHPNAWPKPCLIPGAAMTGPSPFAGIRRKTCAMPSWRVTQPIRITKQAPSMAPINWRPSALAS